VAEGIAQGVPARDNGRVRVQLRTPARSWCGKFLTIVLPEFVPARWWQHLFHNQRALLIKGAFLFKPHVIVTRVPFHLRS
jgi:hypothetical protein